MDIKNVNGRWRALALAFGLLGVAGAAAAGDAPPPVVVTAEDLRQWMLPAMTKLDATAAGDAAWVAVGRTVCPTDGGGSFSEAPAHLEDGKLVLIDDGGHQYHAVWAKRPVGRQDDWAVRFHYEPKFPYRPHQATAGGWTFVMQASGPEAYSDNTTLGSSLLGAPPKSFGFLFHHYFAAVRWLENTNKAADGDWQYIKGKSQNGTSVNAEGFDLDAEQPLDVSIGCTNLIWTVTLRQEGKEAVVLTHDFSEAVEAVCPDEEFLTVGFTGGSSAWGSTDHVCVRQEFSGIAGAGTAHGIAPAMLPELALSPETWRCAGESRFDENGLLVEEATTASVHRKFGAVGQTPLRRDAPFRLSYDWVCVELLQSGAQGVSFALMPTADAVVCDDGKKNFYYPGDRGSAGFYIRSYDGDGFGWFADGTRESPISKMALSKGKTCRVTVSYDGAGTLAVRVVGAVLNGKPVDVTHAKTFDNLPEAFYPAFFGSTSNWGSSLTAYVQNYFLRIPQNTPRALGDRTVAGAQAFRLASLCAVPGAVAAHIAMLTLASGAAVTVGPEPEGAAAGGSLAVDACVLAGNASVAVSPPSSFRLKRLVCTVPATLTLSGPVAFAVPLDVAVDAKALNGAARTLVDARAAALAATPQFRLLDMEGKEITDEAATLIWEGGVLTYKPRLGLTLLFR